MYVVRDVLHRAHPTAAFVTMVEFEKTSVGAAIERMRANGTLCTGPLGNHQASHDALRAEVAETRCLSCRRRIVRGDDGVWREK